MKKIKDKFSDRSDFYKKYRPTYPQALYDEILKLTTGRNHCWDCGTGNGQVAIELEKYFNKVYATDISEKQLANADKRDNIIYKIERAEKTTFQDSQFDLITVAQAIHWFDLDGFFKEVKRVAANGGILCIWGYSLPRIDKSIDEIIDRFYKEIIGPYWNSDRKLVDNEYKSINFEFQEIKIIKQFSINLKWTLQEFEGYLNSWSGVHNYIKKNKDNPVNMMMEKLTEHWVENIRKELRFPIFMKIGRIEK
jgi:ubiquinone/menaquinone biosynthesis C-methylase UbiE